MDRLKWFDRQFPISLPLEMFPGCLERLEGTIASLAAKVKDVADEKLSTQYNDKWSIKQNIGHLAELDDITLKRIDELLNGVPEMSPAVFEPKGDYNAMPVSAVLQLFREHRMRNVKRYRSIPDDQLTRSSLHPRLKVMMTPVDLAFFEAEHDDHHLMTINQLLRR